MQASVALEQLFITNSDVKQWLAESEITRILAKILKALHREVACCCQLAYLPERVGSV
jgi:hypothetical protein